MSASNSKALTFPRAASGSIRAKAGDQYGIMALAKAQLARPKTAKDALRKLNALADAGFDEAGVVVADAYIRGHGVPQNPKEGLARLKKMALSRSKRANLRLVEIYREGIVDGGKWLVRRNPAKARAILKEIAPDLGVSELRHQQILLDASTGLTGAPSQVLSQLDELPIATRQRLVKELRLAAPSLYVDLVRLKLVASGYLASDNKKATYLAKAVKSYCSSRGARNLCIGGASAPLSAEVLQALF